MHPHPLAFPVSRSIFLRTLFASKNLVGTALKSGWVSRWRWRKVTKWLQFLHSFFIFGWMGHGSFCGEIENGKLRAYICSLELS